MDFLEEAKVAAAGLKLLNAKIDGLTPDDAKPVIGKLKLLYNGFLQTEEAKTAAISNLFTDYKKYKTNADVNELKTRIKPLLTKALDSSTAEVQYCLQYLKDIETCIGSSPEFDYSENLSTIRTKAENIQKAIQNTQLTPTNITNHLDSIVKELNKFAINIKNGIYHYADVTQAVIASGIPEMLKHYREPLWEKFCKLFTIEAAKKVVKAEDYYGFTWCLTFIVLIMKITGTKTKKVTGLPKPQTVNDQETTTSKNYKQLLGSGWFSKAVYNELNSAISQTKTLDAYEP